MTTLNPNADGKAKTREELLAKLDEDIAVARRWVTAYPSVLNRALLRDLNRARVAVERGADVQPVKENWLDYLEDA